MESIKVGDIFLMPSLHPLPARLVQVLELRPGNEATLLLVPRPLFSSGIYEVNDLTGFIKITGPLVATVLLSEEYLIFYSEYV